MVNYTEKTDRYITLGPNGEIMIKDIVYIMNGEEIVAAKPPHRTMIPPEADRPADVIAYIDAKKVKQPKK